MALVDILEIFPTTNSGYSTILNILRSLAPKVRDAADPTSGVWWLVMTQPGKAKNYFESSGSAMFVYSLLKGVRLGYIPDADGSIVKAAKKAYQYMVKNWVVANADGTMNWLNTVEVSRGLQVFRAAPIAYSGRKSKRSRHIRCMSFLTLKCLPYANL